MFKPTYLYIKQHKITGKSYFGKTFRKDVERYNGSGTYWNNHIRKHDKQFVETIWYCLFYDEEECSKFAKLCSEQWNIVESIEWANQMPETGLDSKTNFNHSEETKKRLSGWARRNNIRPPSPKGKRQTREHIKNNSLSKIGKLKSTETKNKISLSKSGKRCYWDGINPLIVKVYLPGTQPESWILGKPTYKKRK